MHEQQADEAIGPDVERHLAAVFETARTPYALLDLQLRYVAINAAFEAATGRPRSEMIGLEIFDVFPAKLDDGLEIEPQNDLAHSLHLVLTTGQPDVQNLLRYDVEVDGRFEERYWYVDNLPIFDDNGDLVFILNHPEEVTSFVEERRRMGSTVSRATPRAPSQQRAFNDVFRAELSRLESLNDLALALVGATTPEEVGQALARDGVALAGASAGSLVLLDSERFQMVAHTGLTEAAAKRWSTFLLDAGREPFSDAILAGESLFFRNREELVTAYPAFVDEIDVDGGHQAWAVLPLTLADHVVGAIGLIYDEPQIFTTPIRLVLYTLANLTAQAASRAQLLTEQGEALRSVEHALEPLLDEIPGISVTHLYQPATMGSAAGGDWYDIVRLSETRSLVAIGDVANHGAVAVGEMSRTRATVHSFALAGLGPSDIAHRADQVLTRLASTHTTAVVAILDHTTMTLTWTTAGHPYPILVHRDGTTLLLDATHGAPLGVGATPVYGHGEHRLEVGETLVLYTDGLIEGPRDDIDTSMHRLQSSLSELANTTDDLAARILDRLQAGSHHHRDDIAILTLHHDGP